MSLERDFNEKLRAQEKDLIDKIEAKHDEAVETMTRIRENIAAMAGKYGAIVAGVVSIGAMILKWVIDHHGAVPK